jgi:hypothetical protein
LLNLTARLNDLARPKGIVIAGSYLFSVIPTSLQKRFKTAKVYVRGIAEEKPMDVFFSQADVILPSYALQPLNTDKWEIVTKELAINELQKLIGLITIDLPAEPVSYAKTKLQLKTPNPKLKRYSEGWDLQNYEYYNDAAGCHLRFHLDLSKSIVERQGLTRNKKVSFVFQFVKKHRKRPRKKKGA